MFGLGIVQSPLRSVGDLLEHIGSGPKPPAAVEKLTLHECFICKSLTFESDVQNWDFFDFPSSDFSGVNAPKAAWPLIAAAGLGHPGREMENP